MAITRPRITEEEFLRLPDDGRKYELVDGEVKEVPAGHRHDAIGANIIVLLGPSARGKGFLAGSQAGFRMNNGNIRSPDVSFTSRSRLPAGQPSEGFEQGAPDLAIEIISPFEDRQEAESKLREYFDSGARLVWHVFPDSRSVQVFMSPADSRVLTVEQEINGGDVLSGFRCIVSELFDLG